MIRKSKALESLRPGAEWVVRGDEVEWLDSVQTEPTTAEIEAEVARLTAEYEATQYQRDRQPEYPDHSDLADALYWSNQGDNTKLDEYYAKVSAVKTKYPKP